MTANRMSNFEIFIGTWNTTGEVLETHFIVHDVDARFDGKPTRSMEMMGYDISKSEYLARSFDDQGSTEVFVVALKGRRWSISGKTGRFGGAFDVQKNRLKELWELKSSKFGWQPWIKLELVRA